MPSLPQYAFTALCSVKAQGQLYLYLVSCSMMFSAVRFAVIGVSCLPEIVNFIIISDISLQTDIVINIHAIFLILYMLRIIGKVFFKMWDSSVPKDQQHRS
jgi:hypothetical protein